MHNQSQQVWYVLNHLRQHNKKWNSLNEVFKTINSPSISKSNVLKLSNKSSLYNPSWNECKIQGWESEHNFTTINKSLQSWQTLKRAAKAFVIMFNCLSQDFLLSYYFWKSTEWKRISYKSSECSGSLNKMNGMINRLWKAGCFIFWFYLVNH